MQKSEAPISDGIEGSHQEQSELDMNLYVDYEQINQRVVAEAKKTIAETQRFETYLTVLAQRLCESGLPKEKSLLHIRNHQIYKQQYDENILRAIVSSAYAETV